jgi:hypothetical protein
MEKHWMRQFTERLVRFHLDFMNPILQLNPRLFGLGMSRVRPRNMVNPETSLLVKTQQAFGMKFQRLIIFGSSGI